MARQDHLREVRSLQASGNPAASLTIMRTDTVFAKLPIHQLAKAAPIDIEITKTNAQGVRELYWQVSPSAAYGAPQLLAYKLDTLVINRYLDALERPLPTLIRLESMRAICQELGLGTGKSIADVKKAFHQNAGAYITAKVRYRGHDGQQRRLETGFTRYGVVFTGESLPDGSAADAVYIMLSEPYRQALNAAPTRPVDYDYLSGLKPLAQRFYELLSFRMFAALKHGRPEVSMRYSEFCLYAPQHRHLDGVRMSKQMHKVHQSHLASGYLAQARTERARDDQGAPDWLLHYAPGPKALAEYHAFTRPSHHTRPSVQMPTGAEEPAQALSGGAEAGGVETTPGNAQLDARLIAPGEGGHDTRVERQPGEPAVSAHEARQPASHPPEAAGGQADSAAALVQQFYREVHGVADKPPHPQELAHASGLLQRHGAAFAAFFLGYAKRAMREEGRLMHVFGGVMRYEASALAAYARQQRQQTQRDADRAAGREAALRQQYQRRRAHAIQAYVDQIGPGALAERQQAVRQRLEAGAAGIPRAAFNAWAQAALQDQLAREAGVPDFDDWRAQHSSPSPHAQERRP